MTTTPLSIAAQFGNVQEVLALIEAGADINVCNHIGWTPLYMAAGNGHDGVVKALMLKATEYGHETTVQILIEAGADTNKASYSGMTPLFNAKLKGRETILRMLTDLRI
jgi:cytohesin